MNALTTTHRALTAAVREADRKRTRLIAEGDRMPRAERERALAAYFAAVTVQLVARLAYLDARRMQGGWE